MLTKERVRGTLVEISEKLSEIGYETQNIIGPVDRNRNEISPEEANEGEDARYFLVGSAERSNFYIMFALNRNYAMIVYPMNVCRYLGSYLDEEETEQLLGEEIDWEETESDTASQLHAQAAKNIVENTDPREYHQPAFTLSAYASTAVVDYQYTTTENGFPIEFQCVRGLFPYSESVSLSKLDELVHPVLIAGERGRRYVEYSFQIDKDGKEPIEYQFQSLM